MVGGESTIYDSQGREIGYSKPGDDDAPRCYIRGKEVSCDGIEWEDEAVYNLEESTLDDAKVIEELKQEVDKKQGGEPSFSPELYRGTDENGKTVYFINGGGEFVGGSDQIYNSQGNKIADRYWSDMLLELEDGTSALSYCDLGDGKRLKCDYKWEEKPIYNGEESSNNEVIEKLKREVDIKRADLSGTSFAEHTQLYKGSYNGETIYKITWSAGLAGGSTIYDSEGNEIGLSEWDDMAVVGEDFEDCFINGEKVDCDDISWEEEPIY